MKTEMILKAERESRGTINYSVQHTYTEESNIEIKIKSSNDIFDGWVARYPHPIHVWMSEDIPNQICGYLTEIWHRPEDIEEVRWNHMGSTQGHYFTPTITKLVVVSVD